MGKTVLAPIGAVTAAIGSALCCVGPLVAVALGVSGAGLAATFEPLRPYFVAGTVLALGLGFSSVYREESTRWWGGLIWGLIIEVGMMTTAPMVVAMDTGFFGLKLGKGILNGVFLGSLFPHISYGIVLGLLLERYVAHRGTLLALLRAGWQRPISTITPGRGYAAR